MPREHVKGWKHLCFIEVLDRRSLSDIKLIPGYRVWRAVGIRTDGAVFQAICTISEEDLLKQMNGGNDVLSTMKEKCYEFIQQQSEKWDEEYAEATNDL